MSSSGAVSGLLWRASVATYNRVVFLDPGTGTLMLALEHKASAGGGEVRVKAQPFGGGVRILDPAGLQELIGNIQYDSERSRSEQDFRILVPPSSWGALKQYCLHHLGRPQDDQLEVAPDRELAEEFAEDLQVSLQPEQYTVYPVGFVIEDNPVPTQNTSARGQLTVRLYRVFEVQIVDVELCTAMLSASRRYSDRDLASLALRDFQTGGRGRANSILTLPLDMVTQSYLAIPPEQRFSKIVIEDHELDESVLAVLGEVDVPQYQRV